MSKRAAERLPSPLVPERLYTSAQQPLVVRVPEPEPAGDAILTIVAMDANGRFVTEPVDVRPGPLDLTDAMPVLRGIRRTCYLQLFVDDHARGAALVVQPMLPRIVPLTEPRQRGGSTYTHIAAWQDENAPLPAAADPPPSAPTETDNEQLAIDSATPLRAESTQQGEIDQILSTQPLNGWRVYSERDVMLHTEYGPLHIALRPDAAPNTAFNFVELAAGGLYDSVNFHRIVPVTRAGDPFVIQGGDPAATG